MDRDDGVCLCDEIECIFCDGTGCNSCGGSGRRACPTHDL